MDASAWIALGFAVLTGIGYAVWMALYVSNKDAVLQNRISAEVNSIQRQLAAQDTQLREKIENNFNLAVTKLESVAAQEAKARHDLANLMQVRFSEVIVDCKALEKRINDLVGNVVVKADLQAAEQRMTALIEKLDSKLEKIDERIQHT